MLQSLASLVFILAAASASLLIAMSLSDEWPSMRRALGLGRDAGDTPPCPRVRVLQAQRVHMLRVTPGELRRAA